MEWNKDIFALICGAVALVGSVVAVYQIYKMTVIDAKARGLKHLSPSFYKSDKQQLLILQEQRRRILKQIYLYSIP